MTTAQRGNRKSDESCISKWRVEVLNRTGRVRVCFPVRFKTSTLHFEMQDSSDFRFPLWAVIFRNLEGVLIIRTLNCSPFRISINCFRLCEVILSRSLNSMSTEPEVDPVPTHGTETKALPGVFSEIRWWVRDIFFAVGTAIMIVVFLYQPVKVEGTSMLPELRDQERIFVNKFVYRIDEINRKDIVDR